MKLIKTKKMEIAGGPIWVKIYETSYTNGQEFLAEVQTCELPGLNTSGMGHTEEEAIKAYYRNAYRYLNHQGD